MEPSQLDSWADGIVDAVRDYVRRCLAARDERLDALERRLAELQQPPAQVGPWHDDE